ncbi:glucose dehydrogenase [FAD, quinone]-like [Teleopsis dalmanni]|uniref:glucose dehydrogenase [FAD, quinone]-like n=1 Tax=Teleopsis dalmanni TaxID=139649 RepID=UPI0018CCC319|nr:glucose dehydrogenase [FAD, quinone]-like [Teleopsis dalmanni]
MFCFNLGNSQTSNKFTNFFQLGIVNSAEQKANSETPRNNATYDFIIIGGGSAGCTLANRLTENPNWNVYLIEAGGVESLMHLVPALANYMQQTHSNWGYKSVPQKKACFGMRDKKCSLPRGKVLGGTSSLNYMIYNRGNRYDFDRWAAAGNIGWSYNEVLPYFLKSERAKLAGLENSPYHNRTGPMSVEDVSFRTKFVQAYVKGAQEAGHRYTDYNGQTQMGVSYVQANTKNGRRNSAYRAFIEPIRNARKNLHIINFAKVTKLLINPITKETTGVEYIYQNKYYRAYASREVILSAGSFNTPQLLMLSGVGPADNLKAVGIPIIKELPVGKNLYDHMCHFGPTFLTNTTDNPLTTVEIHPENIRKFISGDATTPFSSIGGVEALTFAKAPNFGGPADLPDYEIVTVAGSLASDEGTAIKESANIKDEIYNKVYRQLTRQDHFTVLIMHFHPISTGRVWLRSRNPLDWPVIDPNYFDKRQDVEVLLAGIKDAIRISKTNAMQKIGTRIHTVPLPGCEQYKFGSDEYWRCSIHTMSYTLHHQVGTCRMGPVNDGTAVVSSELNVHGIQRLRVVDASVIPFPPTAHTNAATVMIAEKAADLIKSTWRG